MMPPNATAWTMLGRSDKSRVWSDPDTGRLCATDNVLVIAFLAEIDPGPDGIGAVPGAVQTLRALFRQDGLEFRRLPAVTVPPPAWDDGEPVLQPLLMRGFSTPETCALLADRYYSALTTLGRVELHFDGFSRVFKFRSPAAIGAVMGMVERSADGEEE